MKFKHTNRVLAEIVRLVQSVPTRKVYLVEGEATICVSETQMRQLAKAWDNTPDKRVAEFTDADVSHINANGEKFFHPETGNIETHKFLDGKWRDIFNTSVEIEAEIKAKSKGEQDFAKLMALAETLKAQNSNVQVEKPTRAKRAKAETPETPETE